MRFHLALFPGIDPELVSGAQTDPLRATLLGRNDLAFWIRSLFPPEGCQRYCAGLEPTSPRAQQKSEKTKHTRLRSGIIYGRCGENVPSLNCSDCPREPRSSPCYREREKSERLEFPSKKGLGKTRLVFHSLGSFKR